MLTSHLRHPVLAAELLAIQRTIYRRVAPLDAWMTRSDEPIEFADLDLAAMAPITPGHRWGRKLSCAWLRLAGEVPAGLLDPVIMLRNTGEGLVHTPDGVPFAAVTTVRAVGEIPPAAGLWRAIEPVPVRDGRTEVLIDCGFNGMRMINLGTATFHGAYLAERDSDALAYFYDYLTLGLDVDSCDDAKRAARLTAALRESFKVFEAGGPAEAHDALADVLAGPGEDFTYTAIGHGHLDLAWLWPIRETKRKSVRTFVGALQRLEKYPEYVYGTSQPQQLAWLAESRPELFERVREAIAAGRIEMQGGFWVEPDTNLPGGESLIRQALYGRRFIDAEFGVETPVCWLPDAFGYSGALPQILRGCGMPFFSTIKLSWNKVTVFPYRTFRWRGIDGSEVLVHMPPEGDYNSPAGPPSLRRGLERYPERDLGQALIVYGSGDGGGGPNESHLELLARERDLAGLPRVREGQARDFFAELARRDIAHEHSGELYLETHQGTYTTQAKTKYYNRLIERLLHNVEALAIGREELDDIWREVLLYQFHDILPGSAITRVYDEAEPRYEAMRVRLGQAIRGSLGTDEVGSVGESAVDDGEQAGGVGSIGEQAAGVGSVGEQAAGVGSIGEQAAGGAAAGVAAGGGGAEQAGELALANLTSLPRHEYHRRHGTWYRAELAPYSAAIVKRAADSFPQLGCGPRTLTNGRLTLQFGADGQIVSCTDATGHELAGGPLNELVLYLDKPEYPFNAWDIDQGYRRKPHAVLSARASRWFLDGPTAVRESVYRTGKVALVQRVILTADSDLVLFDTKVDWQASHRMLRAEFYPADYGDVAHCDIQFGHIDRVTTERNATELAQFEVCAHKWIATDAGGRGFALLNDCKYGHRAKDGLLSLNLLRAPIFPDKNADRGRHRFRYAFMPYRESLRGVIAAGYALNHPLLPATRTFSSLVSVSDPGVIVETVKLGEDGGVVLRAYESLGRETHVRLTTAIPHTEAWTTDMLERPEARADLAALTFRPFEIKTIVLRGGRDE